MADNVKVSFGFSKKKENKVVNTSAIKEESKESVEERDFVTLLEGNEVKSVKAKETKPKELVIPLITQNRWVVSNQPKADDDKNQATTLEKNHRTTETTAQSTADDEAIKELIEEAARHQDKWEEREKRKSDMAIPLLLKNKVPEGFETDDKLDMSIRPDGATDANYAAVPVEAYGLAMLRGMGWKPGAPIGNTFKRVAQPIESQLRPKGLGLGAERRPPDRSKNRKRKPGDKVKEEAVVGFGKGVPVLVLSGPHKELYGKIEGLDEDNARLMVKLAISQKTITISQMAVEIVKEKEYKKYSKDLSRLSKAHRQKDSSKADSLEGDPRESSHSHRQGGDRGDDAHRDKKDGKRLDKHRNKENDHKKRKHEDDHQLSEDGKDGAEDSWLRRDLRVRFIDKHYKKGKYYNDKMAVVDVVTRNTCTCRTEEGRLLEDVKQAMLETLIPKSDPGYVMIVSGKYRGKLGVLLKKDKSKCIADIQLLEDRDKITKQDFDSVCEYIGDIHDEEDF